MSIFDVRHQSSAQMILQRSISSARTRHAYVFHGPEGVGKAMSARQFAQMLLCLNRRPAQDPPAEYADLPLSWMDCCGACEACKLFNANAHPDCHHIHKGLIKFHTDSTLRNRKAQDLGVDVIRQFVIEAAGKKPTMGPAKVFIIEECQKLSIAAQNALLKTLEEPPPDTYIILMTTSWDGLLPTTRSRCQAVPFKPLPPDFVADRLRSLRGDLTDEQIHYFSRHEPGSLGCALQLIDDGYYECNGALLNSLASLERTDSLKLALELENMGKRMGEAVQTRRRDAVEQAGADGSDDSPARRGPSAKQPPVEQSESDLMRQVLGVLLGMMATIYRDLLHLHSGSGAAISNLQAKADLTKMASRVNLEDARRAIRSLCKAEYQLNLNANRKLCLENLAIELARLGES